MFFTSCLSLFLVNILLVTSVNIPKNDEGPSALKNDDVIINSRNKIAKVLNNCPNGANCQVYTTCALGPCLNGGTCQNITDGYVCTCTPGYSGTNCDIYSCSFYITEYAGAGGVGGFISKVDGYGNVIRITSSGANQEQHVVSDGSLIFYTTALNAMVWRVSSDNPCSTRATLWQRTGGQAVGIGITKADMRLFVDEEIGNTIIMLDYEGTLNDEVSVGTATGRHRGLAPDEVNRILYFPDDSYDYILSVPYTTSGFTGNVAVILSGTDVGDAPRGLVLMPEEKTLFWILGGTYEIRSMLIGTNKSEVVVPADNTINGAAFDLAICGENFFHTLWIYGGGIWRVSREGGARVQITTSNTMRTSGIVTAG